MAVIISPSAAKREWNNTLCDCCGQPGGGTCLYVMCCPCCAAGDIAKAAGRDYCMTCCVIPYFVGCILPCWLNCDRAAYASKFGIEDSFGGCTGCLLFTCGCHACLLCQELNTVKAFEAKGITANTGGSTTVVMMPGAGGMPGQPIVISK